MFSGTPIWMTGAVCCSRRPKTRGPSARSTLVSSGLSSALGICMHKDNCVHVFNLGQPWRSRNRASELLMVTPALTSLMLRNTWQPRQHIHWRVGRQLKPENMLTSGMSASAMQLESKFGVQNLPILQCIGENARMKWKHGQHLTLMSANVSC